MFHVQDVQVLQCFEHRGTLDFVGSFLFFSSLSFLLLFLKLLFTDTVHTALEHHKILPFPSSLQPQVQPFSFTYQNPKSPLALFYQIAIK